MALIGLYWRFWNQANIWTNITRYVCFYANTNIMVPIMLIYWSFGVVLQHFLSIGVALFACFKLGLNLILCEKNIFSQNWFSVTYFQRCNKNLRGNLFLIFCNIFPKIFFFCNIFSTITYVNLQYRVCPSAILSGHILQKKTNFMKWKTRTISKTSKHCQVTCFF